MGIDKKWLVKSSDTILGPYEFDQVVNNIFNGDIHLLDEIKGPFERWRPIKDHSLFAAAIEKLKATTYSRNEPTITATLDINTQTHEITRSQTISQTDNLSQTPHINDSNTPHYQPQSDEVNEAPATPQTPPVAAPIPQQQVRRNKSSSVFMFSFLMLVVGGAFWLVYQFQQSKLIEQKISVYDQLTDKALIALKTGEYESALKNFMRAYNISPLDPNLVLEMAPLSVQFDGQFSKVQVTMENLLANNYSKDFTKRGRNVIGLTHSYRGQFKDAIASYNEAIGIDDQYFPAYLNKALALVKMGSPGKAVKIMREVVRDYPEEAISHFLYIRSLVELGIKTDDPTYFQEALSVSTQFEQNFADFKQEVHFLIALAKMHLNASETELVDKIKKFLEVDFELTNLHVHDTMIDFQSFNWVDFVPHCQALQKKVSEYDASLLKAFCLLKINRTLEAKKIFEDLLSRQNDDGILQALYASTLLKLNELSQAKNVLGFLSQVNIKQPIVETILRGCLRADDLSCAKAIFRGRHSRHISLLYSHWGNGEIHANSDRRKVKNSTQLGLEISPNFAPLLKLKRKL